MRTVPFEGFQQLSFCRCFKGNQTSFKNSIIYEDAVKAYNALKTNEDSQEDEGPEWARLHPRSSLKTTKLRLMRDRNGYCSRD